jgi:thioesterase domain-containing protein
MTIPAADNMGLREEGVVVVIPLAQNVNDKGCLFAGSIFAGATLAAYRAAERLFAARGLAGDLLAKGASIRYLARIESDGLAAAAPQGEPREKPNGNRALAVRATVCDAAGALGAELDAEFVLLAPRAG